MIIKIISFFVVVYLSYDIFHFYKLYDISDKLSKKAEKYQRIGSYLEKTILVFGDSTTVGTGASNKNASTVGLLGAKYPASQVLNFGINGAKLKDVAEKEMPLATDKSADLILLQVGANDIVRFTNIEDVEKELKKVIVLAKEKLKKSDQGKIIILHSGNVGSAPIFPFYISYLMTERTRKVRDIYIKICKDENVNYVDLFQEKSEDIFLSEPDKFFAPDHFHPTDAGYKHWFEKISDFL